MEGKVESFLDDVFQEDVRKAEDVEVLQECLQRGISTRADAFKSAQAQRTRPVRIYLDGCFDLMHSGHYNALRQAKMHGDILVAGVHSDAEIGRNKGPTVFNNEERMATVRACKWVDEVVFDVPYSPTLELLEAHNIDYAVHGDDMPTNTDGTSAYGAVQAAGKLKIIKRTEGVSTTDLVGRMLLLTRNHHIHTDKDEWKPGSSPSFRAADVADTQAGYSRMSLQDAGSTFLPTTKRLLQFANTSPNQSLQSAKQVVYIDGAFDLFHVGHIETLEAAKARGDFLLVGVHNDTNVNRVLGGNYPIMNLHERVLNVLSCKYVDEVIMGVPLVVTKDLITTMNVKKVVASTNTRLVPESDYEDPYAVPKSMGIFEDIPTTRDLRIDVIVQRILDNRTRFEARNRVREAKEKDYVASKTFVPEL
mmetsp:Transcript_23345/g.58377  ORF Transcript_23345/g.58377 Transcript_23345/m.58377 type:complete len:420 (-) Transcript_23345:41-1300(-)